MNSLNENGSLDPNIGYNVKSEATTAVPSENVSNTNLEKEQELEPTDAVKRSHSSSTLEPEKKEAELTAIERASSPEDEKAVEEITAAPEVREGDDEAVYPTGIKLFLVTIALCLSVFLVALDNTIIATAIPKITDRFQSLGDVGWYASAYLLTTCALQLFFGK